MKEEPKVVKVQENIPLEPSEPEVVHKMMGSPTSRPSKPSPVIVIADVHVQPKDHVEKPRLHSPRSDFSNEQVRSEIKPRPVTSPTGNSNVPSNTEKVVEGVTVNGHLAEDVSNNLNASPVSETSKTELTEEKGKPPDEQSSPNSSVNLEDSFDILGGNYDNQLEDMKISHSPMPMLNSPLKISSSDHLTSTPVARDTKTNDSVSSSDLEMQMDENKVNEAQVQNKEMEGSESPTGRGNKSGKTMTPRTLSDDMDDEKNLMRYSESDLDRALALLLEDDDTENVSETRKDSMGSDNENEDEEEKLKLLRMSIASAFGQKKNESQVEEDGQDSDRESENPYMDDLDIAKEIYRSKGTTIPPTNHVFSRTLNTIPEDDIPTEVNIVETASNSNTNSTKSSPTKKALKFDDPFDENIFSSSTGDTFEWDDYIGDELVGKVNDEEFQDSPRQSMDFPDWTLEMDASSNSGTESLNHSKAGSEASDSRPGSRTSNRLSTSESEVKSPVGLAARSYVKDLLSKKRSSASPSLSSYISDKSSFYALSHNYGVDSSEHVPSDTELSNSPVSISNGDGAFIEDWDLV